MQSVAPDVPTNRGSTLLGAEPGQGTRDAIRPKIQSGIANASAICLGLLLIWAAVLKAWQPRDAMLLIHAVAPALSHPATLAFVCAVELCLGTALVSGIRARVALGAFVCLLAAMSGILFYAKAQGFAGNCGCLGIRGTIDHALARNAGLIVIALIAYFAQQPEGDFLKRRLQ